MDVLWPLWVKLQLGEMWQFDVMECFPQKIRNMDPWNWFLNINILWEIWYDFLHFLYRTTQKHGKRHAHNGYMILHDISNAAWTWRKNIFGKKMLWSYWSYVLSLSEAEPNFQYRPYMEDPAESWEGLGFREIWHPTALKRKFHLNKIVFKQKEKLGSRIIFQLATYSFFLGLLALFFQGIQRPFSAGRAVWKVSSPEVMGKPKPTTPLSLSVLFAQLQKIVWKKRSLITTLKRKANKKSIVNVMGISEYPQVAAGFSRLVRNHFPEDKYCIIDPFMEGEFTNETSLHWMACQRDGLQKICVFFGFGMVEVMICHFSKNI